jgi:hypothetical protein
MFAVCATTVVYQVIQSSQGKVAALICRLEEAATPVARLEISKDETPIKLVRKNTAIQASSLGVGTLYDTKPCVPCAQGIGTRTYSSRRI